MLYSLQYFNHIQCRIVRKELYKPKIKLFQRLQHKREANDGKGSGDPLWKFPLITVTDQSGGVRDVRPLPVQILSFSRSFRQICNRLEHPMWGWCSLSGKSWNRHCIMFMWHGQWQIREFQGWWGGGGVGWG